MPPSSDRFLEPPADLAGRIFGRIQREEARRRRFRLGVSLVAFSLSVVGLRIVLRWVAEDLAQSGFGDVLSLVFVDTSVITRSGEDFMFALLETLPALSISLGGMLFIAGIISGWSLFKTGRLTLRVRQLSHE